MGHYGIRRWPEISAAVLLLLFVLAIRSFSFPGAGPDGGVQSSEQRPQLMGTVAAIDEASLTVMTDDGKSTPLAINEYTSFVRESAGDKYDLIIGSTVQVMGRPSGQNILVPDVIRIADEIDIMPRSHGKTGPQPQRPGRGGGGPMAGRASGDRGRGAMMPGPVVGAIVGTHPLMVRQSSGVLTMAKLTERTRIVVERTVSPSEAGIGSRVRVFFSRQRGSAPAARKVLILSAIPPPSAVP